MTAAEIYQIKELTPAQKDIIRATVPTLEQAGELLTSTFYKNMISNNPVVRPFFSKSDQVTLRQPKILAFSLLQYAKNIDDLAPLTDFVTQIVHKHVGLQVQPEHYPIVGGSLLGTMVELLGPTVATAQFLEAWGTAYGNLAQILINAEHDAYIAAQTDRGAWPGFMKFCVSRIEKECDDVKNVYFAPCDKAAKIATALPGQYICIRWGEEGSDEECSREYSLLAAPENNEYRVSVRLVSGGEISTKIHSDLKVGDAVRIAAPLGNFVYRESASTSDASPVVFVAGGIGITPLLPMINVALKAGKSVTLINCNQSQNRVPFVNDLENLQKQYSGKFTVTTHLLEVPAGVEAKGRLTPKDLDFIQPGQQVYMVGPRPFMREYKQYFASRDVNVSIEYFGPMEV